MEGSTMNERKIKMRMEQLEKTDPRILRKILEILLKSSLGRIMDILMFGNVSSPNIPIDKKSEDLINILGPVGVAAFQAQEDLLEESEILSLEQGELLESVEKEEKVNLTALDVNHKLGEIQKREMAFLEKLLRLEIDFVCGNATIGRRDEDIGIKEGFQITIPIDPEGKVVPFPMQP